MPFQKGHQHGAKSRLFDGALRRAIAQDDGGRLRAAAEKLLTLAAAGEAWAIKELADRLDGKAQQNVSVERKNASDLTLAELVSEMAGIAGGGEEASGSADEPNQVH